MKTSLLALLAAASLAGGCATHNYTATSIRGPAIMRQAPTNAPAYVPVRRARQVSTNDLSMEFPVKDVRGNRLAEVESSFPIDSRSVTFSIPDTNGVFVSERPLSPSVTRDRLELAASMATFLPEYGTNDVKFKVLHTANPQNAFGVNHAKSDVIVIAANEDVTPQFSLDATIRPRMKGLKDYRVTDFNLSVSLPKTADLTNAVPAYSHHVKDNALALDALVKQPALATGVGLLASGPAAGIYVGLVAVTDIGPRVHNMQNLKLDTLGLTLVDSVVTHYGPNIRDPSIAAFYKLVVNYNPGNIRATPLYDKNGNHYASVFLLEQPNYLGNADNSNQANPLTVRSHVQPLITEGRQPKMLAPTITFSQRELSGTSYSTLGAVATAAAIAGANYLGEHANPKQAPSTIINRVGNPTGGPGGAPR